MPLSDEELLRYSRQVLLPDIDISGQEQLQASHVLIIGMGGLGCPAAQYLAASGVGKLTLVDMDTVDLSNLQRQILYTENDIGKAKVDVAQQRLHQLNPHIDIQTIHASFDQQWAKLCLPEVDLVLDCTDHFQIRSLINAACVQYQRPLISAAATAWKGQLTVLDYRRPNTPCMSCLFGALDDTATACVDNGVVGPVVGMIGLMQALEAVKLLVCVGESASGRFKTFDGLSGSWSELTMTVDPQCVLCGA